MVKKIQGDWGTTPREDILKRTFRGDPVSTDNPFVMAPTQQLNALRKTFEAVSRALRDLVSFVVAGEDSPG